MKTEKSELNNTGDMRRRQAEDALSKYSDLYDFAPIGLFTIDMQGLIQEVNLLGASLLGVERRNLMNRLFSSLLRPRTALLLMNSANRRSRPPPSKRAI